MQFMKRIRNNSYLLLLLLFLPAGTIGAKAQKPPIVPEVKEWHPADSQGVYSLPSLVTIQYNSPDIRDAATILRDDFSRYLRLTANVTQGDLAQVVLFWDESLPFKSPEGYRLVIAEQGVRIEARSYQGIIWGTRSLLQLASKTNNKLPLGTIVDAPDRKSRGFMLDVGRKFIPLAFLDYYVELLSYYKMNEFQIHLNDNGFNTFFDHDWDKTYAAFRLESNYFPGLTAKDGHYTKKEFQELQRKAQRYGVNIIPEVDVPAHSLAFVHFRPEIGSNDYGKDHLDLHKEATYSFVDSLYAEYLTGPDPVFIGKDVHIGTDEYSKKELEPFRAFTDRYLKYIKSFGKTPRLWGSLRMLDGKTPIDLNGVISNAWNGGWSNPIGSAKQGAGIISTCDAWLYIVPAAGYYYDFLNHKYLYNNWRAAMVNPKETMDDNDPALLGAMFAVWNDHVGNGITAEDIHIRALPAIATIATKTWNEKPQFSFLDFIKNVTVNPELPSGHDYRGYISPSDLYQLNNNWRNAGSFALTGKSVKIGDKVIGYNYTFRFDIRIDDIQAAMPCILSHDGFDITLNAEGKLQLQREGKTFTLNELPALSRGEWHTITISGTHNTTTVTLDGKVQKLSPTLVQGKPNANGHTAKMYLQPTFYLPLGLAGDGIIGEMRNLQLEYIPRPLF